MSEPAALLTFVGRMKVHALAQLVGMSVEELVAAVVRPSSRPARAGTPPPAAVVRPPAPAAGTEPPLAAMLGRASYRQIRAAVDQWVFTRAFAEAHTMSGVARRLHIGRHTVPGRWARVRDLDREDWSAKPGHPLPAPPPPSLTAIYERGGTYAAVREALERWMLGAVLVHTNGNVLQATRVLDMARTQFRKRWARVGPKP